MCKGSVCDLATDNANFCILCGPSFLVPGPFDSGKNPFMNRQKVQVNKKHMVIALLMAATDDSDYA